MLNIQKDIPIKQTIDQLAKFKRFSLVEKIQPKFFQSSIEGGVAAAREIQLAIRISRQEKKHLVLGLGSGSTLLTTYTQLVRLHKEQQLSFSNVVVFSLDEYYPISQDDPQSYSYILRDKLLSHIDIPEENIHLLDGSIDRESIPLYCEEYEKKIKSYGGIDIQVLGIGRNGNIGFNEPPAPINSGTRLVYLHRITRKDTAGLFGGLHNVPQCAITMGIATIKKSKRIIIMAWSQSKAPIVKKSIEGEATGLNPATFLHDHPNSTFFLDFEAGEMLSRFKTPWNIKGDSEDPFVPRTKYWICQSIIWLSQKLNKPILRLTHDDYEDNGLSPLCIDCANGRVEDLNLFVYQSISEKITGWPLGDKPSFEQQNGQLPFVIRKHSINSRKVLIFSPHPDDDVISMGGTLAKLVSQNHKVSVAYMTAGSNAVHDYDAQKYLYFISQFSKSFFDSHIKPSKEQYLQNELENLAINNLTKIQSKKSQNIREDNDSIVQIKHLIRNSQAKIAVERLNLNSKNTYDLNLPFYGSNKKKQPVSNKDYQIIRDLLRLTEPQFIYAAGDLTDPHGTHRKCLEIILKVIDQQYGMYAKDNTYKPLVPPPQNIFLYRGAWEEWDIAFARYLVLMSPQEVIRKHESILMHQSQKDTPMFPGDDSRQFWMRVKQRNRQTAIKLQKLGLSEYQAFECFVDLKSLRQHGHLS